VTNSNPYFRIRRIRSAFPVIVYLTRNRSPILPSHSLNVPTGQMKAQKSLLNNNTATNSSTPMTIWEVVMVHDKAWFNR